MKKIIAIGICLASALFCFCSCGIFSSKGVQDKTFVYSSCTDSTVKSGTSEAFYTDTNPAGSTEEEILNTVVDRIYSHGTSDVTGELSFSSTPVSGWKYNDKGITVYAYNHTEIDEHNESDGGYYISLNNDFTSIQFFGSDSTSDSLTDRDFCGRIRSTSSKRNGINVNIVRKVTAYVTSALYDASAKTLTLVMDVTYTETVNDEPNVNAMTYTLVFTEK